MASGWSSALRSNASSRTPSCTWPGRSRTRWTRRGSSPPARSCPDRLDGGYGLDHRQRLREEVAVALDALQDVAGLEAHERCIALAGAAFDLLPADRRGDRGPLGLGPQRVHP